MVIDTSALLAIVFHEEKGSSIQERLDQEEGLLLMSTVNLTEFLILIRSRLTVGYDQVYEKILTTGIRFIPPTVHHAEVAAKARLQYPLNLGDCFVYALAKDENEPILTLDPDFKKTDAVVIMP